MAVQLNDAAESTGHEGGWGWQRKSVYKLWTKTTDGCKSRVGVLIVNRLFIGGAISVTEAVSPLMDPESHNC